MNFGWHISIDGGLANNLRQALVMGAQTVQIFLKAPMRWGKSKLASGDIATSHQILEASGMKLFVHSAYLINFCKDPAENQPAIKSLIDDINVLSEIQGESGCVIHLGKDTSVLGFDKCLDNFQRSIEQVITQTKLLRPSILLETSCKTKKGTDLFWKLEDLARLVSHVQYSGRVKVCVDTCHIFVSGYDIRTREGVKEYFQKFDRLIGRNLLKLIHLNDSKTPLGGCADRHIQIGSGNIFTESKEGLLEILKTAKLWKVPMVSETHGNVSEELNLLTKIG